MSASVTLCGRLTADPELRFGATGTAVATFTVVTSERFKKGDEWEERNTTFWRCVAFRQLAENIAETLFKGTAVVATGRAAQENWETKDGQKRSTTKVVVEDIAPSLRWATVKMDKTQRAASASTDDPWASPGKPF